MARLTGFDPVTHARQANVIASSPKARILGCLPGATPRHPRIIMRDQVHNNGAPEQQVKTIKITTSPVYYPEF